jgi:hypothetical protein
MFNILGFYITRKPLTAEDVRLIAKQSGVDFSDVIKKAQVQSQADEAAATQQFAACNKETVEATKTYDDAVAKAKTVLASANEAISKKRNVAYKTLQSARKLSGATERLLNAQ